MAYKRYIKRGKNIYGPYVYHSRKENGKVISEYKGKEEKKKKLKLILGGIFILLLLLFLTYNFIKTPTTAFLTQNEESESDDLAFIRFVIELTKAEHLDNNRQFISDIYNGVKSLDDVWSEEILNGDYVRVTFEEELTSESDITIYPRVISGTPKIEVYEADQSEIIAEFNNIISNEYNKVFLTNLQGSQDTFDLMVLDGSIEIEHVIDPGVFNEDCSLITDWTITGNWVVGTGDVCYCLFDNVGSTMDSIAIDLSASNIKYANLSFDYENVGLDAGVDYLKVYVNNTTSDWVEIFTTVAAGPASVEINISAHITLDNGVHIRGMCKAGNKESCSWDNINLTTYLTGPSDNPPNVTLNSPVNYYNSSGSVTFNCTGSDDINLVNVSLYGNWTVSGWHLNDTNDTGLVNNTPVVFVDKTISDGTYVWNCQACDNKTATQCSFADDNRTFTVDATPPYFTDGTPTNKTSYDNTSLSYDINASDDGIGLDGFAIDDTINFSIDYSTGVITNSTPLVEYYYVVNVSINDTLGNLNWSLWGLNVTETPDTTPPTIQVQSPTNTSYSTSTIWFNATADESISIWIVNYNGTNVTHAINNSLEVEDGFHQLLLYANDSANNFGLNDSIYFTVDATDPTVVSLNYPVNNSVVNSGLVDFNFTAKDNFGLANCSLYTNFTESWAINETVNNPANNTEINITVNPPEGTFIWNILCYDIVARSGWYTNNYTVIIDETNPNATINQPGNDTWTTDNSPDINITLTDNLANPINYTFYLNDTANKTGVLANNTPTNIPMDVLSDGLWLIIVEATDNASNSYNSSTLYLKIDTISPVISHDSPANGTYFNYAPYFNGTCSDDNLDSIWTNLSAYDTIYTSTPYNFTNTSGALTEQIYSVRISCNDSANNTATSDFYFTFDVTNPITTLGTNQIDHYNGTDTSLTFDLKCSDNINASYLQLWSNFTETWHANQTNSSPVNDTYWNISVNNLPEGTFIWGAYCNDSAENSGWSSNRTLTIDRTAPTDNNPTDESYLQDSSATIDWILTDNYASGYYYVRRNETLQNSSTAWENDTGLNVWVNTTTLGVWNYTIFYNDSVGNNNSDEVIITISSDSAPDVTLNSPVDYYNTTLSSVTFNCTANDDIKLENVSLYGNWTGSWLLNETNDTPVNNAPVIFDKTISDGIYIWNCKACDNISQCSFDSANYTFSVDTTYPIVNIVYPENNTDYTINVSQLNYTYTETNCDSVWWNDGTSNSTRQDCGTNWTGLTSNEGSNTWTVYINDTSGNENSSSVTFNKDTAYPQFSNFQEAPANNSDYSYGQSYQFNVTIINTNGTVWISFDGTNYTAENLTADEYNVTLPSLSVGTYNYNWSAYGNGTLNNLNISGTRAYVLNKAIPTGNLTTNDTWTITYPTTVQIGYSASNGGDGGVVYKVYRDNVDKGSGETVTLGFGTYDYVLNTTGGTNYTANASIDAETLTVNKNTGSCSVLFNESSGITYGTIFKVWTNCTSGFVLYRNSSTIDNNSEQSLGASSYNFTVIRNDTVNYSNYYDEREFIVNKATPTLTKKLNGADDNRSINYPTEVNASASTTGGTVNIYRNSTNVTDENNINVSLAVNYYEYEFNVTGNENYTDVNSVFLYATVNKGTSEVATYIDNVRNNKSVLLNSEKWLNATLITPGSGNIELWYNDTSIEQGPSPLSNLTNFTTEGEFNVTSFYDGNENYTSTYETWWVTVSTDSAPTVNIVYPENISYNSDVTQLNYTVEDDIDLDTCWYSTNGGATNETITTCGDNVTGLNANEGSNNWTVYANDSIGQESSDIVFFTKDTIYPTFSNYLRNPDPPNEDQDIQVNVTITDANLDTVILEWNSTANYTISTNVSNEYYFTITNGSGNYTAHDNVTYYWYANDTASNLNKSAQQSFTVANRIPSLTVNEPDGSGDDTKTTFNVTWSASDDDDEDSLTISCYGDVDGSGYDKTYTCFTGTANDGSENCDVSSWDEDTYYIWCNATDGYSSNADYSSGELTIDKTGPSIGSETKDKTPNEDQDVQLNATVTDSGVGLDTVWVNVSVNNTAEIKFIVTSYSGDEYYFNLDKTNYTAHDIVNWTYHANDTLDNLGSGTMQSFTVANQIPSVSQPLINDTIPLTNDILNCTGGTFSDNDAEDDTEQARYFKWYDTDVEISGQTSQTLDLSVDNLDKGDEIKCSVRVYDGYDNSSWVNSSNTATIQNSPPVITNPQTTVDWDANTSTYNYDYEATDADSGDSFTWYDNTTLFDINLSTGIISDTPTEDQAGTYSIRINVSDGTINATDDFTYTINDVTSPSINFQPPTETDESQLTRNYILVNVTASDGKAIDTITVRLYNSTSLVQTNTSSISPLFVNFTNLPDENYYFNATVNDTSNNPNQTETKHVSTDTGPPTINYVLPTEDSGVYKNQNYVEINVTASDPNLDKIVIRLYNSAHIQINSTISSTPQKYINFSSLDDGLYYYNATANDTFGNDDSLETRNITLDTIKPSITNLVEFPTSPATWTSEATYQFNATITDTNLDKVLIEFNDVNYTPTKTGNVYNLTLSDLATGDYNYYWYANDTAGNVNQTSDSYTINNASGDITLLINDSASDQSGPYGIQTNASAATLYGTVTLYRNETNVTSENNVYVILAADYYNYTAVSSGDQNHSSVSITRFVDISKATTSEVNLTLNVTDGNVTINRYTEIYLNGTLVTGDSSATLKLYNNETLINQGPSPRSNLTTFSVVGVFNVTVFYIESQNYTSSYETWWVNVTEAPDQEAPSVSITSVNDTSVFPSTEICINATVIDSGVGIDKVWTYITYPNATQVNVTMTDTGSGCGGVADDWYGVDFNVGSTQGTLTVNTTYANDTVGNLGNQTPWPNLQVTVSDAPPTWSNPSENDSTPNPTDIVRHNVYWQDDNELSYATLEVNGTGASCNTVNNVSNITLSQGSQWANLTWQVPNACEGRTIGWRQYANDSENQWNNTGTLQVYTVQNVNPTASGTDPIDTYNSTSQSVTFNLSCSDNLGVSTLILYGNWTETWHANQTNSSPINDTTWSIQVNNIPEGVGHVWGVWCNDTSVSGNSDWSDNRTFTIDSTAPTVTLPVYTNATPYRNDQNMIFNISVSDAGIGASYCSINVAGNANQTLAVSNGWCNGTYALTGIGDGNKTINAYANDTLGNTALNNSFVVWVDDTAPTITLPVYINATKYRDDQNMIFNISVSDAGVGADDCTINVDTATDGNVTVAVVSGWCNGTYNLAGASDGNKTINAYANDTLGNTALNNSYVVWLDSTAPTIQFVSFTETSGDSLGRNYIQINVTASDDTNLDKIVIRLYNSTSNLIRTNTSASSPFPINYTELSADTYYFNATANDTVGNNIPTETRNISLVLPELTIIKPENETYIHTNNLLLNYIADYEDYVWYNNGSSNITLIGNTTFNTTQGQHTFYLYANNTLGETARNVTFSVDINKFKVIYNEFKDEGSSTDFNQSSYEDLQNLSDIVLENTDYGKIEFNEIINITNDANVSDNETDLDTYINISLNHTEINSTALPNFNKSATLYLYNLTFSDPRVLRDGEVCPDTICTEIDYSGGTLSFNVTHFTVYSAEETPPAEEEPPGEEDRPAGGGAECTEDSQCTEDEICWNYRCVKLFDVKIIDFDSPVQLGEFFGFTYFIKGIANINDDVEVRFWIEKDGEIVTSGSDTIYLGSLEEKTETTKIFLPTNTKSGIYQFYIEVYHQAYQAKSHRTIEIRVGEGIAEIIPIDMTNLKTYVILGLIILALFILFVIFYLERKKIKRGIEQGLAQETRWIKKHKISILVFVLFIVLGTLAYSLNVFGFLARWLKTPSFNYFLKTILILFGLLIIVFIINKTNFFQRFKSWRAKRKEINRLKRVRRREIEGLKREKIRRELRKVVKVRPKTKPLVERPRIQKRQFMKAFIGIITSLFRLIEEIAITFAKFSGKLFRAFKIFLRAIKRKTILLFRELKLPEKEIKVVKKVKKHKPTKKRKPGLRILFKLKKALSRFYEWSKKVDRSLLGILKKTHEKFEILELDLEEKISKGCGNIIKGLSKIFSFKKEKKEIQKGEKAIIKTSKESEKTLEKAFKQDIGKIKGFRITFPKINLRKIFALKKERQLIRKGEKKVSKAVKEASRHIEEIYNNVLKALTQAFGEKSQENLIHDFKKAFSKRKKDRKEFLEIIKNIEKLRIKIRRGETVAGKKLNNLRKRANVMIGDLSQNLKNAGLYDEIPKSEKKLLNFKSKIKKLKNNIKWFLRPKQRESENNIKEFLEKIKEIKEDEFFNRSNNS